MSLSMDSFQWACYPDGPPSRYLEYRGQWIEALEHGYRTLGLRARTLRAAAALIDYHLAEQRERDDQRQLEIA